MLQQDPAPGKGGEALGGRLTPARRQHSQIPLGMFKNFSPFDFFPPFKPIPFQKTKTWTGRRHWVWALRCYPVQISLGSGREKRVALSQAGAWGPRTLDCVNRLGRGAGGPSEKSALPSCPKPGGGSSEAVCPNRWTPAHCGGGQNKSPEYIAYTPRSR